MLRIFHAECAFGWLGGRDHLGSEAATGFCFLLDGWVESGDGVLGEKAVAHHVAAAFAQFVLKVHFFRCQILLRFHEVGGVLGITGLLGGRVKALKHVHGELEVLPRNRLLDFLLI